MEDLSDYYSFGDYLIGLCVIHIYVIDTFIPYYLLESMEVYAWIIVHRWCIMGEMHSWIFAYY